MKNIVFVLALSVLMIAFQNCAKVGFESSVDGGIERISGPDTNSPDVEPPYDDTENEDSDVADDNDNDNNNNDDNNNDNEYEELLAECDKLKPQSLLFLDAGSSIVNTVGITRVKSEHIVEIRNNIGALRVLGLGSNAKIDKIDHSVGSLVLCNIDVGELGASTGSVRVIGGSIGKITGPHTASIRVFDGDIGEVSNSTGSISVRNGSIGSVTNNTGAINIVNGTIGPVVNQTGSINIK